MDYNKFGFKNKVVDKFNNMYGSGMGDGPGDPPKKTDNGGSTVQNKNYKAQMAEYSSWRSGKRDPGLDIKVTDPVKLKKYMESIGSNVPELKGMELEYYYTDATGTQSFPSYKMPSKTVSVKPSMSKSSSASSTKAKQKPKKTYVDPDVEFAYRNQTVFDPETGSSRVRKVPYAMKNKKGKNVFESMDTPRVVYPSDEPGFVQATPLKKNKKK